VVRFFQAGSELESEDTGALLVSPFNVEWGCYAWAWCVEVLEFCLFLVVFLARYIFSVSPKFYFRLHTFCFLLLVAILESVLGIFKILSHKLFSWASLELLSS
jgi:hypothetical protein